MSARELLNLVYYWLVESTDDRAALDAQLNPESIEVGSGTINRYEEIRQRVLAAHAPVVAA